MAANSDGERWPPVYDAEELSSTIDTLAAQGAGRWMYSSSRAGPDYCQGDVLEFHSPFPYINETGQAVKRGPFSLWLLIGNTCDLSRDISDLRWTSLIPILRSKSTDVKPEYLTSLKKYRTSRTFFVPSWFTSNSDEFYYAPLPQVVTVHRQSLESAKVLARLNFRGWLLLHSCVVRYLARDDGRND